ncbi:SGNH/GDSL hydrolase family protein [Calothrix sp. FACHB-1219]|uniref:GDSL-type esterase/lipase family protein n=1 Tax=unclassified Calothrix TaxID=2619626 RepID=UPI001682DBAC|nr:GDSL-type esterase/lipase family protein [Calothrix sp. FACHB-168]MBD2201220.1 SGNH/GDSL hydrolase family protein [Calothrix sp. FACHB-168]MBD2215654.1 SGNH/GDSL hydrolase family protein [Calothrix sp. FACHB-1219]
MKLALAIALAVIIGLLVGIEVGLRSLFGFGNPLIYISDPQIGYLLAPNQKTRRFGNRIEINEYSMRSQPITKTPAPNTIRVLILGDSIANGGWWTDQDNTISQLLMGALTSATQDKYQQIEVLNASANSWGPRNELAYLQRFGNFQSQAVVLLINTDDLFATAPTSLPVGRDRNYPDRKPPLAIIEVWERYLIKDKPHPELQAVQKESGDRVGINLAAIGKIQVLTQQSNSQFLLVMTPLLREIGEPGSRDYEIKARQRLKEFTEGQQITYIDVLPIFNNTPNVKALYQDHIHLNLAGNRVVSQMIARSLLGMIEEVRSD